MKFLDDRLANTPPYFNPDQPPTDMQLADLLDTGVFSAAEIQEKFNVPAARMKQIQKLAKNAGSLAELQQDQDA